MLNAPNAQLAQLTSGLRSSTLLTTNLITNRDIKFLMNIRNLGNNYGSNNKLY